MVALHLRLHSHCNRHPHGSQGRFESFFSACFVFLSLVPKNVKILPSILSNLPSVLIRFTLKNSSACCTSYWREMRNCKTKWASKIALPTSLSSSRATRLQATTRTHTPRTTLTMTLTTLTLSETHTQSSCSRLHRFRFYSHFGKEVVEWFTSLLPLPFCLYMSFFEFEKKTQHILFNQFFLLRIHWNEKWMGMRRMIHSITRNMINPTSKIIAKLSFYLSIQENKAFWNVSIEWNSDNLIRFESIFSFFFEVVWISLCFLLSLYPSSLFFTYLPKLKLVS